MRGHDLSNRVARLERRVAYLLQFAPKSLTANSGTFSLTGMAATLRAGTFLTAGTGAFALTGQTAALRRGLRVTAGAGSYALTGQSVTLKKGIFLTAAAGSFAMTGSTATLRQQRKLVAAAGSFALTGQSATLTVSSGLDLTFRASPVDPNDLTTYTFSSVAIGTANSERTVFVAVTGAGTAGRTVTGVTIGGVTATVGGQQAHADSQSAVVSIWAADVPTGTTADVVVTWNGGQLRCGIGVWTANGINSLTPVDTKTSQADPATATLTTVAGRVAIVAYYQRSDPGTVTWGTPLNPPDYGGLYETSRYQGGRAVVPSGTSLSISVDPSANDSHVMLAVSYD